MDDKTVLRHLEDLADKLGIQIRYDALEGEAAFYAGGLCRIRGKQVIIINSQARPSERIQTLVNAFRRLDLSQVYLRPGIRDLLEMEADSVAE